MEEKEPGFECDGFDRCPAQTSPELRIDLVLPIAKIIKSVCPSRLHSLNWIRQ